MKKRVSVHDVANRLGISIASVSKALNGNPGVGDALRAKVLETASTMGYQANTTARMLRMGRSHAIGCMVDTITNPLLALLVDAMERHLTEAGYTLLLANAHHDRAREREIVAMFEDRGMDGAIISSSFLYPVRARNPFAASRLPLVMLDRKIQFPSDMVWIDHRDGARRATRHLIDLGHRRIAMFTAGSVLRPATERVAGYKEAFREIGIEVDDSLITPEGPASGSGYEEMKRLLAARKPPTALVCLGTRLLSGALRAIRQHGMHIPQSFSVVAIGEANLMEFFTPEMTMLRYDMALMGETAAKLMVSRLEANDELPPRCIELPMPLIPGASTAPVGDGVRDVPVHT